jgi:hypothetical protein
MKVLKSGTLVWVDPETRVAEVLRCSWLVEVATGNPEPDGPEDLWRVEECGAKVKSLDGTDDHTRCERGHTRHAYGTPEAEMDLMEFEARQRAEGW